MKTSLQEFSDELRELRAIAADYKAMKAELQAEMRALRKERREQIDICIAHNDVATLEAILAHLERTCCAWERWPGTQ